MKFTTAGLTLVLAGLVTASVAQAQATATYGVQADERIPADTFLYVSVPSMNVMKERLNKTHGWKIWSDPAFDDFRDQIENAVGGKLDEFKQELQKNLGVTLDELLAIPSGQVTMAISAAGNEIGLILFVDFGDSRRTVEALLAKANEGLSSDGLERTTVDFEGTEISVYAIPGQENNPVIRSVQYCVKDTELVFSTSMGVLKHALSNWDGTDKDVFNANESWAYVKERCNTGNKHGAMNWFFDPIGLFNSVAQSGMVPQAAIAAGFLPTLGLDNFEGMGGVIDFAVGKYDTLARQVYLCEEARGILKIFTLKEGADLSPPAWVPATVSVYSALNWDIEGAYGAVENLVDSFSAPGTLAAQIDQIAQDGPGIHIKNDIVDQLTGKLTVIGDSTGPTAAPDPNNPAAALFSSKMIIGLGCKDEAAMGGLLTKLTETPGFPGEVREFRDTTIVEIPNPQGGPTLGLSVARGNLMFATDVTLLEAMIRGGSEDSLVNSETYKRVASEFPSNLVGLSYSNTRDQMKSMYEGLRSGDTAQLFPGMEEVFEVIDFTKLPSFEAVAKYMVPTGGYTIKDDRGAFQQSFSLAP